MIVIAVKRIFVDKRQPTILYGGRKKSLSLIDHTRINSGHFCASIKKKKRQVLQQLKNTTPTEMKKSQKEID